MPSADAILHTPYFTNIVNQGHLLIFPEILEGLCIGSGIPVNLECIPCTLEYVTEHLVHGKLSGVTHIQVIGYHILNRFMDTDEFRLTSFSDCLFIPCLENKYIGSVL